MQSIQEVLLGRKCTSGGTKSGQFALFRVNFNWLSRVVYPNVERDYYYEATTKRRGRRWSAVPIAGKGNVRAFIRGELRTRTKLSNLNKKRTTRRTRTQGFVRASLTFIDKLREEVLFFREYNSRNEKHGREKSNIIAKDLGFFFFCYFYLLVSILFT